MRDNKFNDRIAYNSDPERMNRKHYTFLVIPHTNERIRNLKIPHWLFRTFLVLIPVFILSPIVFWGVFIHNRIEISKLHNLDSKNRILTESIEEFQDEVSSLNSQLVALVEFDNKIRLIADLSPIDQAIRKVGQGGTALPQRDSDYSILDPVFRIQMEGLRTDIDQLRKEMKFQGDSFREIISSLETKAEILRHTPSITPASGWLTDRYGMRRDPFTGVPAFHHGIDIATQRKNEIIATADGIVEFSGWNGNFGKVVRINHRKGYMTVYAHNYRNLVKKGDRVKRGDVIALVGNSGRSTGPHLHYEVRYNGKMLNPLDYVINRELLR